MTKKFFLLLVIIALSSICLRAEDNNELVNIIELPGMTKEQIYNKSIQWLAESFQSAKTVIELQDPNGQIIGNVGTSYWYILSNVNARSKMIIDIKDNKARLRFVPVSVQFDNSAPRGVYGEGERNQVFKSLQSVIESFNQYLKSNKEKNNDW